MKVLATTAVGIALIAGSVAGAGSAQAATTVLNDPFTSIAAGTTWADGAVIDSAADWQVRFAGYGSVSAVGTTNRLLRLAPAAATTPNETHAALVVSANSINQPCQNVTTRMRTTKQLRKGSTPNPWETAWLTWSFTDEAHFYYLALKPNGWELGKRDPAYPGGQRFLATGPTSTAVGQWRTAVVKNSKGVLTVTMDGVRLVTFTDSERPYSSGSVGMYTEDAIADWDSMRVTTC